MRGTARRVTRRPRRRGRGLDPRFDSLGARLEAVLVQAIVAFGVVLIAAQVLLTLPAARYVMSYVDRLEGIPLSEGRPSVTIVLSEGAPPQSAALLVNGKRAAGFSGGQITVNVLDGDLLEVDGTALDGQGVFEVIAVGRGVTAPAVGSRAVTDGGVATLGRVELEGEPD